MLDPREVSKEVFELLKETLLISIDYLYLLVLLKTIICKELALLMMEMWNQ